MPLLGETLAQARAKRRLSQSQVCELVGISKSHLSRIESGKVLPSFAALERLCNVLELSERKRRELERELEELQARATVVRLATVVAEMERNRAEADTLAARLTAVEQTLEELVEKVRAMKPRARPRQRAIR